MLGVRHWRIMWPWYAGMGESEKGGEFPSSDSNILNTYSILQTPAWESSKQWSKIIINSLGIPSLGTLHSMKSWTSVLAMQFHTCRAASDTLDLLQLLILANFYELWTSIFMNFGLYLLENLQKWVVLGCRCEISPFWVSPSVRAWDGALRRESHA